METGGDTLLIQNEETSVVRDKWSKKMDFVISGVGFAVGLGNIWRFPYLCYKNGGGAFFIPYIVMLLCGGIPIFVLEVGLGQYMSKGGLHAWNIAPLFKGIGIASTVVVVFLNTYYIIIMAWAVFYFIMSLTTKLPWSHCNNEWNTERCYSGEMMNSTCKSINCSINGTTIDSTVEFWERRVLQISDGIGNPNGLVWELVLSLIFVWVVVYFCVWRGVKWSGKVVYFTALFPYVILLILLIRAATLEGALYGIVYYLKPNFTRLSEAQVWIDGGTQIFFSYAIAIGCMITLGSYNKFHTDFYRQCIFIASVNSGTSILGGFVVFSVLGFMATQQNVDISKVADAGPGLAFITYPKAVAQMPLSPLWAALFFFMIFLVGIDSQFVGVEGFLSNVIDTFPERLHKTKHRIKLVAVYCGVTFLVGLSMVSRGGMYVFQMFDYYSASGMVLLYICFLESAVIGWVFGADKFNDVIELMIGYRINKWLSICWKFVTPVLTLSILIFQIVSFTPLVYNKTYVYPEWAQILGVVLAITSMMCVPVFIVVKMHQEPGSLYERFKQTTSPLLEPYQLHASWSNTAQQDTLGKRILTEDDTPLKNNDTSVV